MTPNFKDVPEHWRHPIGPYRQAPPEFGGRWWRVDPFFGPEPWAREAPVPEQLPDGFERIFGPRPQSSDFSAAPNPSLAYRTAKNLWEQELRHFKQAGVPEWFDRRTLADVSQATEFWGLGAPFFYEGRYGWTARFPDSEIPDFEAAARTLELAAHLTIAQYQIRLVDLGLTPGTRHPFVPPAVWGDAEPEAQ